VQAGIDERAADILVQIEPDAPQRGHAMVAGAVVIIESSVLSSREY
jgi:hypothetical protein